MNFAVLETIVSICFSRLAQVRFIVALSRVRSALYLLKLFRDCGQPFVELRAHEILKDSRFLVVLAGQPLIFSQLIRLRQSAFATQSRDYGESRGFGVASTAATTPR